MINNKYYNAALVVMTILFGSFAFLWKKSLKSKLTLQQPTGPWKLPILGNLHQLIGAEPHVSLAKLATKHGPIFSIWLGSMRTVVISSSEAAQEMFQNHDVVTSGRMLYESMKGEFGTYGSVVASQYGPEWRAFKKLYNTELFGTSRLDARESLRAKWVDRLMEHITVAASNGHEINLGRLFYLMTFNLISNLIFSKDIADPNEENGSLFFYHARKVMELSGMPNLVDFFPILRRIDPQNLKRRINLHSKECLKIVEGLIEERLTSRGGGCSGDNNIEGNRARDYLDVLLDLRDHGANEDAAVSSQVILNTIIELFSAGADTTSITMEWAMTELLNNPHTLEKVQSEIRANVPKERKLEEKDIEDLPYLKAVIKETLRLHPPVPLLLPHMSVESFDIFGYNIPKETQVLVNVWAIGRDPRYWENPLAFKPERFLIESNNNIINRDYKGQHFEFLPFGSGRRKCPGMPLASRVVALVLGSLLHSFDWILGDGLKAGDVDMSDKLEITLRKIIPFKAIAIPLPYNYGE